MNRADSDSSVSDALLPISRVSVIIPVFNEDRTIGQLLSKVMAVPRIKQIIVVDDGSSDDSGAILAEWRQHGHIQVINHRTNLGKGSAIRSALAIANGEFTIVQDADLEYDPQEFGRMMELLDLGTADVVVGSRYLSGSVPGVARMLRLGVSALNLALRLTYGVRLTDEATCYKITRTDTLRRMCLECQRFEFCPEMLAKACRMGLRIKEVPISYRPRTAKQGKKIRLRDGWCALWTLWRYRKWEPPKVKELPAISSELRVTTLERVNGAAIASMNAGASLQWTGQD